MIKLYSQEDCINCEILKNFFKENKIDYTEYDVNKDFTARAFMLMNDLDATPAVVKDDQIISGDVEDMKKQITGKVNV